jgi:three-Cys-motif partner protein
MGRISKAALRLEDHPILFSNGELPPSRDRGNRDFKSLSHPLWTENKARLIQEYIKLFTYITKHGAYIDGFAAPQKRDRIDLCSAKLVLEAQPRRVRQLWLCDKDPAGCEILREIKNANYEKGRQIHVLEGDFNTTVDRILKSGRITERKATFALLDQRTFECNWETVEKLARHKPDMKIELFYFLATGWLDRSIAAVRKDETAQRLDLWWGRNDWRSLLGMAGVPRAQLVADRLRNELGYKYAYPYAIHNRARGGRTMYHMIHATDHPEATPLMIRAYRKISGRSEIEGVEQFDLDTLWRDSQEEL